VIARRAGVAALAAVAAVGLLSSWTVTARAQTPAPTPGVEFVAALHDALDALPPGASVPQDDPALDRVRAPLQLARQLAPSPAAVDAIIADANRDPVELTAMRQQLQTLIAAVELPPNSGAEDPAAAKHALHDVYAQGQFSGLGKRPGNNDLLGRIGEGIVSFFRWLAGHTVGALGLLPTLIIAGLILAAIIAFVVLALHRSGSARVGGRLGGAPLPRGVDAEDEWRLATAAAERGEHREAVRHAFRSALLAVAEKGRLQVDASQTTSELLARARGDADLVAALAPAADCFERAWYSGRPVSAQDWEVARERCLAVRALAGRSRVTAA
jgi:uncharacterized protein DUF4129